MRSPIQQYIIDRVREKRQAKGMSQEKLSIALGFESQGYISKIESQNYDDHYNIDHLNEIAKIFNCSSREFWPENPLRN
ncbi:MAG: helix-turn-helix transcriptional regulator [Ginsengibacter sp.]